MIRVACFEFKQPLSPIKRRQVRFLSMCLHSVKSIIFSFGDLFTKANPQIQDGQEMVAGHPLKVFEIAVLVSV